MTEETEDHKSEQKNRLLPLIGIEHAIVAAILLGAGIVLTTKAHTNLGNDVTHLARRLGIDPSSNGIQGLIGKTKTLTADKLRVYGIVAIFYGLLEGAEGYGLIRRQRWGEYLTVVATLLLFIPDIYELVKKPSILKLILFILNVAIIVYLAIHLRRTRGERATNRPESAEPGLEHGANPTPAGLQALPEGGMA